MSVHGPREVDPVAAERMLGGDTVDPWYGSEELIRLLAAARAPAQPDELAGEEQIMAAFRQARDALVTEPRRRARGEPALARLLTVKAAAAAVLTAAVATGGMALAAATGGLPGPLVRSGPAPTTPPTYAAAKASAEDPLQAEEQSPSPSLIGLCRAFLSGAGNNPGKALENPAFEALITEAGEKDKVVAYCDDILAGRQDGNSNLTGDPSDAIPETTDAPGRGTKARPDRPDLPVVAGTDRPPTVPDGPPGPGRGPAGGKRTD